MKGRFDSTLVKQMSEGAVPEELQKFLLKAEAEVGIVEPVNGAKMEQKKKAMRALNGLKIVNPLICAVLENPGANDKETAENFKKLVASASDFSHHILAGMGLEAQDVKNYWIRNVLERFYAEVLRDLWVKNKSIDFESIKKVIASATIWLQEDLTIPDEWQSFNNEDYRIQLKGALFRLSSLILLRTQMGFDFFRNIDKDIPKIVELIVSKCLKGVDYLLGANASGKERLQLLCLLLQESGELYVTSRRVVGKKVADSLSRLSDKELQKLLKENPTGLSLAEVDSTFDLNFNRLVSLTGKLLPTKSSEPKIAK